MFNFLKKKSFNRTEEKGKKDKMKEKVITVID